MEICNNLCSIIYKFYIFASPPPPLKEKKEKKVKLI